MDVVQIEYLNIEKDKNYENIIKKVLEHCFEIEGLVSSNLYVSITLTNPGEIQRINKEYRKIDKPTDVLSFPMFEKEEIQNLSKNNCVQDVLGDIIISIEQVKKQAKEYEHSFERELAYMTVHGFYHLMGYDHMKDDEKQEMRKKEEFILQGLNINKEQL